MAEAGKAINDTFHASVATTSSVASGLCKEGFAEIAINGKEFDYVVSMEAMENGQRFGNYSVDFMRVRADFLHLIGHTPHF